MLLIQKIVVSLHSVTNHNSNIMAKTPKKIKEPVKLRFKELADGNKSLYLDIYKGNGRRQYEFLKLYLVPETNPLQKRQNADVLKAANAIKSQRIIELANNEAGIKNPQRGKMLLADWMAAYKETKQGKSKGLQDQIGVAARLLVEYDGEKTRLCDVDRDFCIGFIYYLQNVATQTPRKPDAPKTADKHLSPKTARNYCIAFSAALNKAVRDGLIANNPFSKIDPDDKIKVPESKRTYLTIDEVKQLEATPCGNEAVRRAFLFCCYCGLRVSDARRLRWSDIVNDGGQMRVSVVQEKTDTVVSVTLPHQATLYLPDRGTAADDGNVFVLPCPTALNKHLGRWVKAAGITKKVTFHASRHTAATMLLTAGVDIYTVSKILGHSEVRTTQIYTKVIDQKKDEAAMKIDEYVGRH